MGSTRRTRTAPSAAAPMPCGADGTGAAAGSGGVHAIIEVREGVVPRLDVAEPWLAHAPGAELVVEPGEAEDVVVEAAGGVRHRRPRPHDERPVARLGKEQLARRLVQRTRGDALGVREAVSELHHAL